MRLNPSLCWCWAAGAFACRPVGDLEATRGGSSAAVSASEAASSEPPTPFTPAPTPPITPAPTTTEATTSSSTTVTTPVASTSAPSTDEPSGASVDLESSAGSEPSPTEVSTHDVAESASGDVSASSTGLTTTPPASSEAADTTDPATTCSTACGMGATCEDLTDCLSLRCDGVCQPMEMVVESDGIDAISTSIKMHVELYADPSVAVAWQDLAVLYFVTVEKHDDFKLNFAQGGGTAIPMQVTLEDWILVWTTDAAGNVPATVTPFDVQLHSYPWLPDVAESNDNSNDYSYRSEPGPNDRIVLCRRVSGEWRHAQGTPPAHLADPCRYVDDCDAALSCDPLEPSPP